MNLDPVIDLLRRRIGLDPESLGPAALPRAITNRMEVLGLTESAGYVARLEGDAEEFQVLIGEVTVPETWFFRGGEVFQYLARQVAEFIRRRRNEERFRILTVPCSSGEEPYSLAIALAENGLSPSGWEIKAVDLCERQLARARRGRFGEFSFRQMASELRQRYFQTVEGTWELDMTIRSGVQFRQGNLLDPHFLAGEKPFDLIFCRNLLIYLHAAARRQVLDRVERLLAPEGWLCTGHAEPLEHVDPRFTRTGPSGSFLYRRATAPPAHLEPVTMRSPLPIAATVFTTPTRPEAAARHLTVPLDVPATSVDLLTRARQKADCGQLDEALALCQTHLSQSSPSADAFSLSGVIHQARRERDEAVRCFQRALYLEPGHRDALTHLMLLCLEQGDHAQAERLRRRLDRLVLGGEA
jgi:chemotaxis protein methyltransferase WspC